MLTIPTFHIKKATLAYQHKSVFTDIDISLPAGKWIGLLGPSGVGKSSLLRMIAGLASPHEKLSGDITADNHLPVNQQIAYMAQTDLLFPWLTVLKNATIGLKLRKQPRKTKLANIEKAKELLEKVGLGEALTLYPHQLSGGMRQRVALVRTLMEEKSLILMDEPFSALDAITRYNLQALAVQLLKDKTVLFVTHDPLEALRLSDHIYIMQSQSLTHFAELHSPKPREFDNEEFVKRQPLLFQALLQTNGNSR